MRKLLFWLARSRLAGSFIGFAFAKLSWLMPLHRIKEDALGILFLHPSPFWKTHWLGVPKQSIRSFTALDCGTDGVMVAHLLRMLATESERHDIRPKFVLLNGGSYQDVPQIHFHLASGPDNNGSFWDYTLQPETRQLITGGSGIVPHPHPMRQQHAIMFDRSANPLHTANWTEQDTVKLIALLKLAQHHLSTVSVDGYSLLFTLDPNASFLTMQFLAGNAT